MNEVIQAALEQATAEALELVLKSDGAPVSAVRNVLKFFRFTHLPPNLRAVSCSFAELATRIAVGPMNDETLVALRKLLEAKDAAVRAVLP